jgi:hypothetical protein
MKTKTILVAGLVVAIGCVVAGVAIKRQALQEAAWRKTEREAQSGKQARPVAPPVAETITSSNSRPSAEPGKFDHQANVETQKVATASANQTKPAKQPKEVADPLARVALSLVGVDPDAEQYWLQAINDPNLPADERRELIEDLDQDGLSDPQNPTMDDLPLIVNRIVTIEDHWYYAMDQVNFDAFQEAP